MRAHVCITRRHFLRGGALVLGSFSAGPRLYGQSLQPLHVASAGSMRSTLEGPVTAAARGLGLELHVHAGGADAVAQQILRGEIAADVFIPITASPMQTLLQGGKVREAEAIGRTELVLVYSPASRFAPQFQAAAEGRATWWQVLQQPGMRIGRGNPEADPGARAIVFALMLAARRYNQPQLVETVLGPTLNPRQIVPDVAQKLQAGELDASTSYRIGAMGGKMPYITLPEDINLSRSDVHTAHPDLLLEINGKTFYPEPLIFYASMLEGCANPTGAATLLDWLHSSAGQTLLARNGLASADGAPSLHTARPTL